MTPILLTVHPILLTVHPILLSSHEHKSALVAYDLEAIRAAFLPWIHTPFTSVQELEAKARRVLDVMLPAMRLRNPSAFHQCASTGYPLGYPPGRDPVCTFYATARQDVPSYLELVIQQRKCGYHFLKCAVWNQDRSVRPGKSDHSDLGLIE